MSFKQKISILEWLCDNEDWNTGYWKLSFLENCNISQYYSLYYIFDQIKAVFVNIRDFFLKVLNSRVYECTSNIHTSFKLTGWANISAVSLSWRCSKVDRSRTRTGVNWCSVIAWWIFTYRTHGYMVRHLANSHMVKVTEVRCFFSHGSHFIMKITVLWLLVHVCEIWGHQYVVLNVDKTTFEQTSFLNS